MVGVGWEGVFPDSFFKLHQESTSLLGLFRDFQKSPMPKPAQLDCRGPDSPSELEPHGSKKTVQLSPGNRLWKMSQPQREGVDFQTSPLTWHQVSPHLNHSIWGQRSHRFYKRAQPSDGSNTLPSVPCKDRPHSKPGGHSVPLDDVLLWQLPVERWHQGRERWGAQQIHHGTSEPLPRARTAFRLLSALKSAGTLWVGLLLPQCPRIMTSGRQCAEASVSGLSQGSQMQETHPMCAL